MRLDEKKWLVVLLGSAVVAAACDHTSDDEASDVSCIEKCEPLSDSGASNPPDAGTTKPDSGLDAGTDGLDINDVDSDDSPDIGSLDVGSDDAGDGAAFECVPDRTLTGEIIVRDTMQLEGIDCVIGTVFVWEPATTVRSDSLRRIEGALQISSSTIERVELPVLQQVTEDLHLSSASYPVSQLLSFDAPELEEVGRVLSATDAASLTTLNLPSLHSAAALASMRIQRNPQLSELDLTSIARVGWLEITDNPTLPSCLVDEVVQQLIEAGMDPEKIVTGGNDDTATCP